MSSSVTVQSAKGVRGIGVFTIVAGILMIIAGAVVWFVVSSTLSDEQITVSDDASMMAGQEVAGPFTAYAQADVINQHALEASEGMTYAELDREDPRRDTVMNASFLRASLFTSVVSFGVSALVIGLGVMFVLIGFALVRLGGPKVAAAAAPPGGPAPARTA
ncbi:aromatic ring-opening dioxygenase LigA [Isoptericola sp. b515]|uniref:aromatic ring-opening dioxygenase LigA n=1 Tax=Isoptericola sp. b515 TaxID=3064652 RepID=UPI0027141D3C|nr:aromatic ring-opening dioxygenase LigA [Isoptericola sp. b515]MDO8146963.1 aromatic ring-opening dioxygenase LigA [Isoptericola sp. b515]